MNFTWLYVGALYAIAIGLTRRAGVDIPKRVALCFYLLTLLFFWRPLTGPYVNVPADTLNTIAPWYHLTNDHHQYNSELNDLPLQIVPWAHQVRESWKALDAPLWNAASGTGYPLLGNGQSSAFSLLRLLALPRSLGHAMTAEAAMKILIALTFAFLWCRRRYSLLASVIGAVTFGFCGFLVGWLHFPIVTAACLAPAVFYCADLLIERRTFGRFVFAAAMWAQLHFAGHPETAVHLFWLATLYVLWALFVERATHERWRTLVTLGSVMLIAALLAAPYLIPFLEAMPKSQRVAEIKENPPSIHGLPNTDRFSALLLLQPHFFGQLPHDKPWSRSVTTDGLSGYAGVLGVVAWLAVALHVVRARAWRSREAFFVLATLLVAAVFFGWRGISDAFLVVLPMGTHSRLRLLFALLLAIQTAATIDLARRVPLLLAILAIAITLGAALLTVPMRFAYRFDTAVLAMLPSLAVLAIATWFALTQKRAALLALLVAVIAELFILGRDRPMPLPERTLFPATPLIAKLQELRKQTPEPFRVAGIGPQLFPNTSAIYGLEDIRAHDPMANGKVLVFLRVTAGYDPWNYYAFIPTPDYPVLDFLNVKYAITRPGAPLTDPGRWSLVYDGRDGRILENRNVLPRFYAVRNVVPEFRDDVLYRRLFEHRDWASTAFIDQLGLEIDMHRPDFFTPRPDSAPLAHATIVEAKPTSYRMKVEAPRWSLVASSIPWWPGWVVERNGKRIEPLRVNNTFLGFAVPPGSSEVRVCYSPRSFWIGVWIALATLIGICGSAVRARRYRRA